LQATTAQENESMTQLDRLREHYINLFRQYHGTVNDADAERIKQMSRNDLQRNIASMELAITEREKREKLKRMQY
jgi:hypothetical protein